MAFSNDDLEGFLDAFNAKTITVKLDGVEVKTFRAIHKRRTEFISPHNAERAAILPSLQCKETDLSDVTRKHTLSVDDVEYRMYKEPDVRDSGLATIGLTKA